MSRRDEDYTAYVQQALPWLRRVAYLLGGDWDRADDLVQSTITRLYVKWRHAAAADNIDAYVRTMLVRVFLGEQRTAWWSRVQVTGEIPERPVRSADVDAVLDVRRAAGDRRAAAAGNRWCSAITAISPSSRPPRSSAARLARSRARRPGA